MNFRFLAMANILLLASTLNFRSRWDRAVCSTVWGLPRRSFQMSLRHLKWKWHTISAALKVERKFCACEAQLFGKIFLLGLCICLIYLCVCLLFEYHLRLTNTQYNCARFAFVWSLNRGCWHNQDCVSENRCRSHACNAW